MQARSRRGAPPVRLIALGLLSACLLAACANRPQPLYYWGSYQTQVYSHFKGDGSAEEQILALEKDMARAAAGDAVATVGKVAAAATDLLSMVRAASRPAPGTPLNVPISAASLGTYMPGSTIPIFTARMSAADLKGSSPSRAATSLAPMPSFRACR